MLETIVTQRLVDWVWEKRAIFLSWLGITILCIRSVQNSLDTATREGSVLSFQPTLALKIPVQAELPPRGYPSLLQPRAGLLWLPWCSFPVEPMW